MAQVVFEIDCLRDPLDQRCRLMGVELIRNKYPFVVRRCVHCIPDVGNEVFFCPSRPDTRRDLFAGGDFEVRYQALSAVANVFVFVSLNPALPTSHTWFHQLGWRGAFERLNSGFFIRADKVNALCV